MRAFLSVSIASIAAVFVACSSGSSSPPSEPGIEEPPADGSAQPVSTSDPDAAGPSCCDGGAPDAPEVGCVADSPQGDPADIDVTVDAQRGPHGAAAPVAVDRRINGMNIADWRPQDYSPTPAPAFKALLGALRPGVLRWPAGHRSQEYNWERGGGGQSGHWTLTAAHVDAFIALAKAVGAEPLIALNVKRGTAQAAADLVRYVNVDKKYGVKWFLVGNEPDLTDGIIPSPGAYAQKLIAYADAIRGVDPKAKLIAPELLTGVHLNGGNGKVDWLGPILSQAPGRIDGVSWHYYPLDSGQTNPNSSAIMSIEHLFQETAPDWHPASIAYAEEIMPALATITKAHGIDEGVWITEFAEDPGPGAGAGISETIAGALWVGDALGRYAEYAPAAIIRWVFKTVESHAYGIVDVADNPRPAYGTHWLYAQQMGDRYVASESTDRTEVAAHASLRPDGALAVMLVNKTTSPKRVHVAVNGFCVGGAGEITLTGDGYGATTYQVNGQTLSASNVETIDTAPLAANALFYTELPSTSVRVVVYRRP